ncbi:MAG: 23S rRNA (adenine(2503)-C(2))-methyltransferase RlmN [Thermodesulfobacteria bacterium]|nr:23S rRNA (adenine(2503)-C(2))-methyltransferase RlmN [Thermodesulfobacteriota bacterium]
MESWGEAAFRGRQLFKWLWTPGFASLDEVTDLPKTLRARLALEGYVYNLETVSVVASKLDDTCKWAFRLEDGSVIETVLIPGDSHATLCVSSQVGCAMGCRFCKTGSMGFVRNLSPSEIAGQVLSVIEQLGSEQRPRNLVFMGMGEPLANFENVVASIRILSSELGLNYSKRRITVSTSGIAPKIVELGNEIDVGLAISLHATTNSLRDRLMPINRRYPLEVLMDACRRFKLPRRRRITFEYIVLKGLNHSREDANRLARLLDGIPSKINLIPYNYVEGLEFQAPSEREVLDFQKLLIDKGFTAIIRKSRGRDIEAACGQLWSKVIRDEARVKGSTSG